MSYFQGLCTLSPKFSYVFFCIRYPKNSSRTKTLHTESMRIINPLRKTLQNSRPTKWSLQALRMILLSSRFFFFKKRKYWVYPVLRYREDGEFPLLIKEQQDYPGRFKVYFRMSVAQFDALLAILEPHIKKTTTNFCKLSLQGSIYSALCCETRWMNLTIAILDFGFRLYGGSGLSKHLSKCLPRMNISKNYKKIKNYKNFGVNVIDIM